MKQFLVGLCLFVVVAADSCGKVEVNPTFYTTQHATIITKVAFVTEFSLKCSSGQSGMPLYAEVNGLLLPAVITGKDKYQVSWTDDISRARSGEYQVTLFDEEGYGALRKAMRNLEAIPSTVEPLATISLHHPGTYQGPWVNSELLAVLLFVFVCYLAYSAKSNLLL